MNRIFTEVYVGEIGHSPKGVSQIRDERYAKIG
jgi:hypothetical protein